MQKEESKDDITKELETIPRFMFTPVVVKLYLPIAEYVCWLFVCFQVSSSSRRDFPLQTKNLQMTIKADCKENIQSEEWRVEMFFYCSSCSVWLPFGRNIFFRTSSSSIVSFVEFLWKVLFFKNTFCCCFSNFSFEWNQQDLLSIQRLFPTNNPFDSM